MVGGRAAQVVRRNLTRPSRWPVTWRLAAVSAALTFLILVVFALLFGRLFTDRLTDDFHDELKTSANALAFEIQASASGLGVRAPSLDEVAMADRAEARIVDENGEPLIETRGMPDLGPPQPGVHEVGDMLVASAPVTTTQLGAPAVFVQYARDHDDLDATIGRMWLFLGAGVLIGTLLAAVAGIVVARRAMRPVAALTAAAREITATRDPSRRLPRPATDDEIGELAATLDEMLRALDAARTEREQAMQAQRDFVADASHELRTPLTSTLANLELLQESLEGAGRVDDSEATASALRSSRRMSRLVSDLLLLARADAGRAGARIETDLADIAVAAVHEIEPVAGEHDIALSADHGVPVNGNPDELHRLVVNLIDNALIHTPPPTSVRVGVGRDGDEAVLVVEDDGPGIPEKLREQVFGRFVRGSGPADEAASGGTGLGLAIVRSVAGAHGGSVEAGSSGSGGARFVVRMPLGERAEQPEAARV
jgi:two-component system, OmpR family, sensor kinase